VAETRKRQTSAPTAETQYLPGVMKVHMELTLEQAAVMFLALKHYRAALQFNLNAVAVSEDERQEARHAIFIVDRLKGMFE
jgi:hypothetical protein